ncbi:MAG: helix-hairpin-helix domain-containing protein [Flavobacteriales bacterium]
MGEKRRRELLAHFGGMQGLLSASEREVAGVKGIGAVTARAVYAVLHE